MSSFPRLSPDARIAFLHTSPLHVATFEQLLGERLPQVKRIHEVDVSLLDEVRRDGPTEALREHLGTQLDRLAETSPDLIVCTCSSIGPLAVGTAHGVPVMRLDQAMAEDAIRIASAINGRIGIAASVESTVHPTSSLLTDVAASCSVDVILTVIPCFDAWTAFETGDTACYASQIAHAVRQHAMECDVIVLAQASMAVAMPLLSAFGVPVLASPPALVNALAGVIAGSIDHSSRIPHRFIPEEPTGIADSGGSHRDHESPNPT